MTIHAMQWEECQQWHAQTHACGISQTGIGAATSRVRRTNTYPPFNHSTNSGREDSSGFCLFHLMSMIIFTGKQSRGQNNLFCLTLWFCLTAWSKPCVPLMHGCLPWLAGIRVMQEHAREDCWQAAHFTWMLAACRGIVHIHAKVRPWGSEMRVI